MSWRRAPPDVIVAETYLPRRPRVILVDNRDHAERLQSSRCRARAGTDRGARSRAAPAAPDPLGCSVRQTRFATRASRAVAPADTGCNVTASLGRARALAHFGQPAVIARRHDDDGPAFTPSFTTSLAISTKSRSPRRPRVGDGGRAHLDDDATSHRRSHRGSVDRVGPSALGASRGGDRPGRVRRPCRRATTRTRAARC